MNYLFFEICSHQFAVNRKSTTTDVVNNYCTSVAFFQTLFCLEDSVWKNSYFLHSISDVKNLFVVIFHEGKQDECKKKTRYFVHVFVDTTFFLLGKISFLIYCSVYWFFLSISCPLHEKKFCLEIDFPKWFLALIAWFFRKSKRLAMLFICSNSYF